LPNISLQRLPHFHIEKQNLNQAINQRNHKNQLNQRSRSAVKKAPQHKAAGLVSYNYQ